VVKKLFLGLLFCCLLAPLISWATDKPPVSDLNFYINKNKKNTIIPFQYLSNLLVIQVTLNGSDSLNFILDTGVTNSILTDPALAQKLALTKGKEIVLLGSGSGASQRAYVSYGNTLRLGNVTGKNQNVIVLHQEFTQLSELVGKKIHGIIGYDLFKQFVITVNFETNRLFLQTPESYKLRLKKGQKLAMDIENAKPYLSQVPFTNNKTEVNYRLMIDTGAGHATSLENNINSNFVPNTKLEASLGYGMNGEIEGFLGRIESMKLGDYSITNFISAFPNKQSVPQQLQRNGTIGCEILYLFHCTFNYKGNYIVLKRNKLAQNSKFEHNMAGFELLAKGENFKDLFVQKVTPNGPADLAGIQEDDQLVRIDNISTNDLSLSQIYKYMQLGHGKTVQMVFSRNKKLFITECILKKLI
jgi:hypothetical protein